MKLAVSNAVAVEIYGLRLGIAESTLEHDF